MSSALAEKNILDEEISIQEEEVSMQNQEISILDNEVIDQKIEQLNTLNLNSNSLSNKLKNNPVHTGTINICKLCGEINYCSSATINKDSKYNYE